MTIWDGDAFQQRFDELAASGTNVHGEADFVMGFGPQTVLDAGCGTGRVARELARRGVVTTGVDPDASMIATARRLSPELEWIEADVTTLNLGRTFDLVVMAGNVPLFTKPGTNTALVAGCAAHLGADGLLVTGFSLDERYPVEAYDEHAAAAGLRLALRFATWDRAPWTSGCDYAVSVHRAPSPVQRYAQRSAMGSA